MIIDCTVPVVGVPFIKETRCIKTSTIIARSDTELVVEVDIKTLDAPYSETFTCKEMWIIVSAAPTEQKCIL